MRPIPYKAVFVEVHMKSRKSYNASDFSLYEKVSNYVREVNPDEIPKETLIEDISKIVRDAIMLKDKKIVINQVYVVVR